MEKSTYSFLVILGSIFLLFTVIRPIFTPYLLGSADGLAHKYRLENFHKALQEGIVRPRWVADAILGYGAPLYIFNYAIPYYLVDAVYRLGFSTQTSSQIYAALTIIAAFCAMYVLASHLWGRRAGVVAAIVYTFAPYHLFVVYSYEAWGEMLAFFYPPLLLYLLGRTLTSRAKKWYAATVIVWVFFLLTHNISSYISTPVVLFLGYIQSKRDGASLFVLGKIMVFVLGISAFFTLPAVGLLNTIHMPTLLAKEIALRKLYMVPLGTQLSTSWATLGGLHIIYKEFTVGIAIIWSAITGLVLAASGLWKKRRIINTLGLSLFVILALSLFFVDPASDALYIFLPLQYVLYPYRFLFIATFAGSLFTGYLFRKSMVASLCILTIAILFGYPYTHPYLESFPFPESYFSQPQMLGAAAPTLKSMGIAEFLPITSNVQFLVHEEEVYRTKGLLPQKFILPTGAGKIVRATTKQESLETTVQLAQNATLTVSTLYYPNWKAAIDTTPVPVHHDTQGRITLAIPAGTHTVALHFGYSSIEIIGYCTTIMSIALFVASLIL